MLFQNGGKVWISMEETKEIKEIGRTALTDEEKGELYRRLEKKNVKQVAIEYNFHKKYENKNTVVGAVAQIMSQVRKNPERYGITANITETVEKAIKGRSLKTQTSKKSYIPAIPYTKYEYRKMDIDELVGKGSKKSLIVLNMKLDDVLSNSNELRKLNLTTLSTTAGILFDKNRIVRGESTQHVMLKAKISDDLTPEQKIELVLRMREKIISKDED